MHRIFARSIALLAALLFGVLAQAGLASAAPNTTGLVVSTCGNQTFAAGNPGPFTVDPTGALCLGSITASNPSVATTGAAVPASATYLGGNKSGNLVGVTLDGSSYLNVDCATGCSAGAFNNNADAVATSSANQQAAAWLYAFNGTTFDRLRVDGSKNLQVNINASSATVPISASSLPLPTLAATSTKQSDGSQKTQIVDGSGNVIASTSNNLNVQCANCSGSGASAVDEAAFTAGASVFGPAGGFFQTTATSNALTNGQQGMMQLTAQRALFVNLRNASGAELGIAAAPLQVSLANTGANGTSIAVTATASGNFAITAASGSIASGAIASGAIASGAIASGAVANGAFASGSIGSGAIASGAVASGAYASGSIAAGAVAAGATSFVKLEDVASADADAGVPAMAIQQSTPADTGGTNGDYTMLQMSAGRLWTAANVDKWGGTTVVNGGLAGSVSVGGTVATNVAITDNPINTGGQAVSSENAAVTTARKVQFVADLVGKQIVLPYANPENFVSGVTAAMTGTTTTSLIAAPASGLRNYVTQLICTNSHATVGTFVLVQDGSGGTTIYEGYAAAVGGGFSITFPAPLRQPTTATALFVADVTTGANVICAGSGYKGA